MNTLCSVCPALFNNTQISQNVPEVYLNYLKDGGR